MSRSRAAGTPEPGGRTGDTRAADAEAIRRMYAAKVRAELAAADRAFGGRTLVGGSGDLLAAVLLKPLP